LRRHLADLPLRGVGNRSWRERFKKWRRRSPAASRAALWAVSLLPCLVALTVNGLVSWKQGMDSSVEQPPADVLHAEQSQATAKQRRLAAELHKLADRVRLAQGAETVPMDRLTPMAEACTQTWERRHQIRQALDGMRNPRVLEDLFDLALFSIDLNRRLAATRTPPPQSEIRALDEAEAFFGPNVVLDDVRMRRGLGLSAPPHAPGVAQTEWEHVTLARLALQADDLPAAAAHLEHALTLAPHGFWPQYYYGLCAGRLGQHLEAVSSFSLCIGAVPDLAAIHYERALAYAALRQPDLAIRDYGRALELDPTLAGAALNRGMLHFEAGRFTKAEKDLQHALSLGANPAHAHLDLALVHRAQKQHGHARDHLLRVLSLRPDHAAARELLGQLSVAP
jgi:eukaryotic-like serine/threonine-protein kinase